MSKLAATIGGDYSGSLLGVSREVAVDDETGLLLSAGMEMTVLMINMGLDARALVGTQSRDYILVGVKLGLHLE